MLPLRSPVLLSLALAVLASCGAPPPEAPSTPVAMRLAVSLPAAGAANVTRITVTVSAADMTPRSTDLAPRAGVWGGVLGDLPAGSARTVLAQAFTAANALAYEGRVEGVTLVAGATGLVSIRLQDAAPPPLLNEAPFVDSLWASSTTVAPGGTISLTASAHDPDTGDSVRYAWTAPWGDFSAPSQPNTTWTAPTSPGPVRLVLTVSDSRGATLSTSVTVDVAEASGP